MFRTCLYHIFPMYLTYCQRNNHILSLGTYILPSIVNYIGLLETQVKLAKKKKIQFDQWEQQYMGILATSGAVPTSMSSEETRVQTR